MNYKVGYTTRTGNFIQTGTEKKQQGKTDGQQAYNIISKMKNKTIGTPTVITPNGTRYRAIG